MKLENHAYKCNICHASFIIIDTCMKNTDIRYCPDCGSGEGALRPMEVDSFQWLEDFYKDYESSKDFFKLKQ